MTTDTPATEHEEDAMTANDDQPSDEGLGDPEVTEATSAQQDAPMPATAGPAAGGLDSKNKAVFAHLSTFLTFVGLPAPVGPLVAWLILKDQDTYAADQAKEALNFNISFLLYSIVAGVSIFLVVGFVLLPVVLILWFIFPILAAIAASRGEWYRYPMTLRIVT